jgi:NADPH-dependent curcumin reductase CurA
MHNTKNPFFQQLKAASPSIINYVFEMVGSSNMSFVIVEELMDLSTFLKIFSS